MDVFETCESEVRSYIRSFPVVFERAENALIWDESGKEYIDFLAGAGTLNYGHNPAKMITALIEYLGNQGITHSLDKATIAKRNFMETFYEVILKPRKLDYKMQFTGPTGTNSVEAAIKLARRVTGRSNVIAFTRGYHGLTLGALALTGNNYYQQANNGGRNNVYHAPYDGYFGPIVDTVSYLNTLLEDNSSGVSLPAAIILETVQGEGGIHVASKSWLQGIAKLCKTHGILLIIDDIQVGNGRTGDFFSFEFAGVTPDMVCLSKSIGGGLPLALLLLKPKWDQWLPGEHTGTFRGNNLAFVAAKEMLNYWRDDKFVTDIHEKSALIQTRLDQWVQDFPSLCLSVRGRGMVWGIEIQQEGLAKVLSSTLFKQGLLIETCGSKNNVIKLLPPLTIEIDLLNKGLNKIEGSLFKLNTKSE
ncbi:diaminobutyrate--2-oxoglutarate transaminase [Shewanella sp. VB17]|uniref:diaminobutyrate--2-oxoglutarate transaminase n=1 Tax=Shewanella sp. VB17 TaxID=2739432 RepID=UPI001563B98B|nr:diaminobutyrate--2-oxoglutarate transaminase [Shewanella sp. VB17]NRD75876.1 diaminobutyrate--2-oxoglutarate transaminase [Shewanella sp. VB17]